MCPDHQLISAWLDNEVPSPWDSNIEDHVKNCSSCSLYADSLRNIHNMCIADSEKISPELIESAKLRVENSLAFSVSKFMRTKPAWWARKIYVPVPLAAASVLIFSILSITLFNNSFQRYDVKMANMPMYEVKPVSDDVNVQTLIDYLSQQNTPININISLPSNSFDGDNVGEPLIIREADFKAGKKQ